MWSALVCPRVDACVHVWMSPSACTCVHRLYLPTSLLPSPSPSLPPSLPPSLLPYLSTFLTITLSVHLYEALSFS